MFEETCQMWQDRVAHAYYAYGRFCSSHPVITILSSIITLLLLCHPISKLNVPYSTPYDVLVTKYRESIFDAIKNPGSDVFWRSASQQQPSAYVFQVELDMELVPRIRRQSNWTQGFPFPTDVSCFDLLSEAFVLRQHILHFKSDLRGKSLLNYCLQIPKSHAVEEKLKKLSGYNLPKSGCMIFSPGQLWQNNIDNFLTDQLPGNKIFNSNGNVEDINYFSSDCLQQLAFGMPIHLTGLSEGVCPVAGVANVDDSIENIPLEPTTIRFAISIILNEFNNDYFHHLEKYLVQQNYSYLNFQKASKNFASKNVSIDGTHAFTAKSPQSQDSTRYSVHIFYRRIKTWSDHVILGVSYLLLLFYIYFSVNKISDVKSKWGIAFSVVFTVVSSLCMAYGICLQYDLTPNLIWINEAFPYLTMLLGLENTICITRSVVNMPTDLDVRSRIAHGLSKEGYRLTKNLLLQLILLAIGFLTFVPEIQEFCLFAIIGVFTDFYMQLMFYAPVLTFDLLRLEPDDLKDTGLGQRERVLVEYPPVTCPFVAIFPSMFKPSSQNNSAYGRLYRARSESSLYGTPNSQQHEPSSLGRIPHSQPLSRKPFNVVKSHRRAFSHAIPGSTSVRVTMEPKDVLRVLPMKMPRRIRFMIFWSQTRIVTRAMMLVLCVWIVWIAVVVHRLSEFNEVAASLSQTNSNGLNGNFASQRSSFGTPMLRHGSSARQIWPEDVIRRKNMAKWWPTLLSWYDISLTGKYISVMPPLMLKKRVTLDDMENMLLLKRKKITPVAGLSGNRAAEKNGPEKGKHRSFVPDLKLRISWLEVQMTMVLVQCGLIFALVVVFVCYVCCCGPVSRLRASQGSDECSETTSSKAKLAKDRFSPIYRCPPRSDSMLRRLYYAIVGPGMHRFRFLRASNVNSARRGGNLTLNVVPLLFRSHASDVEFLTMGGQNGEYLISSCLDGEVLLWNAKTGSVIYQLETPIIESQNRCNDQQGFGLRSDSSILVNMRDVPRLTVNGVPRDCPNEPNTIRQRKQSINNQQNHLNTGRFNFLTEPSELAENDWREQLKLFGAIEGNEDIKGTVWCIHAHRNMIGVGYSDGIINLWDPRSGRLRGQYKPAEIAFNTAERLGNAAGSGPANQFMGVIHLIIKGCRLVLARLNGVVEVVELRQKKTLAEETNYEPPPPLLQSRLHSIYPMDVEVICQLISAVAAHQQTINDLKASNQLAITASTDHSLKVFNMALGGLVGSCHGHCQAVYNLCVDEALNFAYSSCSGGLVCAWDLTDCRLVTTYEDASECDSPLALAVTPGELIGLSLDCKLWIWNRSRNHEMISCFQLHSSGLSRRLNAEGSGSRNASTSLVRWLLSMAVGLGRQTTDLETNPKNSGVSVVNHAINYSCPSAPIMTVLNSGLLVVGHRSFIQVWDLTAKSLLVETDIRRLHGDRSQITTGAGGIALSTYQDHQPEFDVNLGGSLDVNSSIQQILRANDDESSVFVAYANNIYRISFSSLNHSS